MFLEPIGPHRRSIGLGCRGIASMAFSGIGWMTRRDRLTCMSDTKDVITIVAVSALLSAAKALAPQGLTLTLLEGTCPDCRRASFEEIVPGDCSDPGLFRSVGADH